MAGQPFPYNLKIKPTPLEIQTLDGFPGGMNLAVPPWEIGDNEARYIQDAFVEKSGETIRRGPISSLSGTPSFTVPIVGMIDTLNPQGSLLIAVLTISGSNLVMNLLASGAGSVQTTVNIDTSGNFTTSPYPIMIANPMLGGGTLIGVTTSDYASPSSQCLVVWNGGTNAPYTAGNITCTYGSKTVTGSGTQWATSNNVTPGSYLMDSSGVLIGCVATVNSNTQLTLVNWPYNQVSSAAYTIQPLRGFAPRNVEGTITVGSGSTSVAGGATSFLDAGVGSGWRVFRMLDGAYVGTVTSVTSNVAMTLTSGASTAMSEDQFYAINGSGDYSYSCTNTSHFKPGFLSVVYGGQQFYANRGIPADGGGEYTDRLWFSETTGPEDVDTAAVVGNFIPISSSDGVNTPIKAISSTYNALLILKEREAFILTGQNESQWQIKKIADDGALSAMGCVEYQGGTIFPGRTGIYYFDGVNANNIVDSNLGLYYQQLVKNFNTSQYRMWGQVVRDHYILFIESIQSTVPVIKGSSAYTPTKFTISIYLPTLAVSTHTNLNIRGSINPTTTQGQIAWFAVNDGSSHGHICDFYPLFDSQGNDSITCDSGTPAGHSPDLYVESKRYSVGNGMLLKTWKILLQNYQCSGDSLVTDTVSGLNDVGVTQTTKWPATEFTWQQLGVLVGTWAELGAQYPTWNSITVDDLVPYRIKFIARNQYFGFRMYQNSGSVTSATLGAFAIAYKVERVGRYE